MIRRKISPGLSSIGSPGGYQRKSFSELASSPNFTSGHLASSPSPEDNGFLSSTLSPMSYLPLPQASPPRVVAPPTPAASISGGTKGNRWPNTKEAYKLEDVIGFGSSAVVHSGYCIPRGEKCAIKKINLEQSKASMEEILKEIHVMVTCSHENVVSYYTSFVVEDELWIVMKLHEGGSLLDVIKATMKSRDSGHGVLDEESIATVLKEVLQGLAYLHKSGQIHRDIKAGNILVGKDGSVQIADFGVSACLTGMPSASNDRARKFTFVGTPCWMSPEVVESNGVGYDFKTDIWSLGITVIEMVRGTAPYMNYPPIKILMLVIQDESPKLETGATQPDDFKNYGKSIRNFISLCLTKDPAKRPTAAQLLKHPFLKKARDRDFLKGKFAVTGTVTPNPPKSRRGRRNEEYPVTTAQWDWTVESMEINESKAESTSP